MQLALPATIGLPEAAYLVGNISTLYVPSLVVGTTTGSSPLLPTSSFNS